MAVSGVRRYRGRKTRYIKVFLLLLVAVVIFGWLLSAWMTQSASIPLSENSIEHISNRGLDQTFNSAVRFMQQGEHEQAVKLWHRILLTNPAIPEVRVNMGFSLFELGRFETARDSFISALEQNAFQANAYYGLAITSEKLGDLEDALGAMKSYIHLAQNKEDQPFIRKAKSAVWEWESQLQSKRSKESSAVKEIVQ